LWQTHRCKDKVKSQSGPASLGALVVWYWGV